MMMYKPKNVRPFFVDEWFVEIDEARRCEVRPWVVALIRFPHCVGDAMYSTVRRFVGLPVRRSAGSSVRSGGVVPCCCYARFRRTTL